MKKRLFIKILIITLSVLLVLLLCAVGISTYVVKSSEKNVVSTADGAEFDADCILVLGAMVRDGRPSLMLRDRLDRAIELHFATGLPLLMSGDRSSEEYDEVGVMMEYALENGVSEDAILIDPQGYSTLESVVRLEEFSIDSAIVVTQEYHPYRALYICNRAGVDAVGVSAEYVRYWGEEYRLVREVVARCKDFLYTLFL